jgi:putative FmdB family regulatory protein
MPIFEYACQDCGHEFEALTRSSAHAEQPECPRCHSVQLLKKLSVFATATPGAGSGADRLPAFADGPGGAVAPCGACGHPDGPGACSLPG